MEGLNFMKGEGMRNHHSREEIEKMNEQELRVKAHEDERIKKDMNREIGELRKERKNMLRDDFLMNEVMPARVEMNGGDDGNRDEEAWVYLERKDSCDDDE